MARVVVTDGPTFEDLNRAVDECRDLSNAVVVQGRCVAYRPRGDRLRSTPSRMTFATYASPLWWGFRRIRIGILRSGRPSSARPLATAPPAARPLSVMSCPILMQWPGSTSIYRRRSPGRYHWACSASSPVCPRMPPEYRGVALRSG